MLQRSLVRALITIYRFLLGMDLGKAKKMNLYAARSTRSSEAKGFKVSSTHHSHSALNTFSAERLLNRRYCYDLRTAAANSQLIPAYDLTFWCFRLYSVWVKAAKSIVGVSLILVLMLPLFKLVFFLLKKRINLAKIYKSYFTISYL